MNDLIEKILKIADEIADYIDGVKKESYEQGRADKYQEITSSYMLLTEKQVEEIRADAIDELVNALEKHQQENWIDNLEYGITFADIEEVAEQLKEQEECNNCEGKTIDFDKISKRVLINKIFEIEEECRPAIWYAVIEAIQNCPPYDCEGLEGQKNE